MQVYTNDRSSEIVSIPLNRVMPIPPCHVVWSVFTPYRVQRIIQKYECNLALVDGQQELKFDDLKGFPQRGHYLRKFFSYSQVNQFAHNHKDQVAYTEHTVAFAYCQRVLCHIVHYVMDEGTSLLESRTTYKSSHLRKYEKYAVCGLEHPGNGVLDKSVYTVGDVTITFLHSDYSGSFRIPPVGGQDPYTCQVECKIGSSIEFKFNLDYETYKDFDFSDYDAVVAHPTLEFDISMCDNPNAYELLIGEYDVHQGCVEREIRGMNNNFMPYVV